MTRRTKIVIAAVLLAQIAAVAIYFVVDSGRAKSVSTKAPRQITGSVESFVVIARDGTKTDLVGGDKPVLVHFWATWCKPCLDELPMVLDLPNEQFRVVAVALDDDWTKVDKFAKPNPRIVLGDAQKAEAKFEISSLPETVLMAPDGRLLLRVNGARNWADHDFWKLWTN